MKVVEKVTKSCSITKVFLQISNFAKFVGMLVSFLIKLQTGDWRSATLLKIGSRTGVNFAKFLRTATSPSNSEKKK